MDLKFGFGTGYQEVTVPAGSLLGELHGNSVEVERTGEDAVRYALENPIGAPKLRDIVKKGEKIAIVTSDITRPMPT